ncbi:MAG TPA: LysR substrate-binding domain-containing protein [Lichenihabitans sp.]|nr:LysR substrate-binding domain-containing protein [Lichenihabitans sp.]
MSSAALDLRVSAGAVSQQIRKLEGILGIALVERRGRSVELTAWGKLYLGEIAPAFAQIRQAQDVVARAKAGAGLVVSCLPSVASRWLGRHIFDWQVAHPDAHVRLVGTETEPRLGADGTDFRLSYGDQARAFEHRIELFTDWVVPVCSPALAQRIDQPADLLRLPLLTIDWDPEHRAPPGWAVWAALVGVPFRAAPTHLVFSLSSAAIDAAVEGRGCVMAQVALITDELASGRLVAPFDRRLTLPEPYFLAWERDALQKPFAREFRAWAVALGKRQALLSRRGEAARGL